MRISLLLTVYLFLNVQNMNAQELTNGDLEGAIPEAASILPDGWVNVPGSDPVAIGCPGCDSLDLISTNAPNPTIGWSGSPYSGVTSMSGQFGGNSESTPENLFQEGIMQNVQGFVPGELYSLEFYQGVVKDEAAADTSGTWIVFKDTTLIGVSASTVDYRAYNDPAVLWECRAMFFTATETSHTLKFLPFDDDENFYGGDPWNTLNPLRMGIDFIRLGHIPRAYADDSLTVCAGENNLLTPNLVDTAAYLWQDGSSSPSLQIVDSGYYWIEQSFGCASYTDSIYVKVLPLVSAELGPDTSFCENGSIRLNASSNTAADFMWNTGSAEQQITVTQAGEYYVEVTGPCNTAFDTVRVDLDIIPEVSLGSDTIICAGNSLLLDASWPNAQYLWQDGSSTPLYTATEGGLYTVFIESGACTAFFEVGVELKDCRIEIFVPNIITPNGDGRNDALVLMVSGADLVEWEIYNGWGNLLTAGSEANPGPELLLWSPKEDDLLQAPYMVIIRASGVESPPKSYSGTVMVK